jgi:hypothetical protein
VSPYLVASFSAYSIFLYYQQLHSRDFRGANELAGLALAIFALAAMLAGGAFLLYYGYTVSWLGALGLYASGLIARFIWFYIEARLGLRWAAVWISLTGFLAIPVLGYFVWQNAT